MLRALVNCTRKCLLEWPAHPSKRDRVRVPRPKPAASRAAQPVADVRRVDGPIRRRIASNFAFLSAAELVCRTTSVIVTLSLAKRLGVEGYGRIEFAFNVVFWLVLLLRDSSDVIVARELSRHPRLIRPLVDQVLAYKTLLALVLFSALALVGSLTLSDRSDLDAAALRFDALHDGDRPRLRVSGHGADGAGGSLAVHSHGVYAIGVLFCVRDASRIAWVPIWLTVGEAQRDRSRLVELPEELPAAAPAAQFAIPVDHGAARADGLLDPAFAGCDQSRRTCWSLAF